MKTTEQIKKEYKPESIDNREFSRLSNFLPEAELKDFGLELKDEFKGKHIHKDFTRENILEQLKDDVAFGFEKALNQRGISSSSMASVVKFWNWVLEEGLESFDEYAQYGLPIFKATAVKYGFENPIGDDKGDEDKYASGY